MNKDLVTVVISIDTIDCGIEPTLCSVLAQQNCNIELFVCGSILNPVDMEMMAALIRKNRSESLSQVYFHQNKAYESYSQLIDMAAEKANGNVVFVLAEGVLFAGANALCDSLSAIINNETSKWKGYGLFGITEGTQPANLAGKAMSVAVFNPNLKPAGWPECDDNVYHATAPNINTEDLIYFNESSIFSYEMPVLNFTYKTRLESILLKNKEKLTNNEGLKSIYGKINAEILKSEYNTGKASLKTSGNSAYRFYLELILRQLEKCINNSTQTENLRKLAAQILQTANNKLKIVFFAQEVSVWPSLHSLYTACAADERFSATVVYLPFNIPENTDLNPYMAPYWSNNIPVMPYSMYDLAKESPDIAVFLKPYDMVPSPYTVNEIAGAVPRLVFIPYGIPMLLSPQDNDFTFQMPLSAISWQIIGGNKNYDDLAAQLGMRKGENLLSVAHPRIDMVYSRKKNLCWPESWGEEVHDKPIFFYNASALIEKNDGRSTFLENHKTIFDFFAANQDVVLIWRAHPRLKNRTIELGEMTEQDWTVLNSQLRETPNIIVDETPFYLDSLLFADAIISDLSTLLVEYLLLNRPILVLKNSHFNYAQISPQSFLEQAVETADSFEDIKQFVLNVLAGRDNCYQARTRFIQDNIYLPEHTAGEDIRDRLYQKLLFEEGEF